MLIQLRILLFLLNLPLSPTPIQHKEISNEVYEKAKISRRYLPNLLRLSRYTDSIRLLQLKGARHCTLKPGSM
ncbi:hypothetical protein DL96DRAFT_1631625, partial [Flagelloscypha sp. PMI_526]